MARPRTVSDEEILLTARRLFLEHGYHLSTSRIAAEVGLSAPALFKRFGTKDDLFVRAMEPQRLPPWIPLCLQGPDGRPIRAQLLELGRAMQCFYADMTPRFAALHGSGCIGRVFDSFDVPPPVAAFRALTHWFEAAMRQGRLRRLSDPRSAAELFFASIAHRHIARTLLGAACPAFGDEAAFLEDLVDALWSGLDPELVSETP